VSAVAVILGLLLVVTFIANYLSTTLPNTMAQNDLQHEVTVQNQVAQLGALVQRTAEAGAVGAQVSQPVTLGSPASPPFAGQDSSTIAPGNLSGGLGVNFTLAGPSEYAPPTGFGANHANMPSDCTPVAPSTTVTCSGQKDAQYKWNFSAGDGKAYTVTIAGSNTRFAGLNFASNSSTISISGISGMPTYIQIIGNNDTLSISSGGGNNPISVNITGNYDTITPGSFPGGSSIVFVHVVGDHDLINGDSAAGGNTVWVSFVGVYDTLPLVPGSGSTYYTYFTGFDTLNPTSGSCPYGALALTDTVTGYTVANGQTANAHLYESFNNSTAYPTWGNLTPSSRWAIHYHPVLPFACPFMSQVIVPVPARGALPGASLVVRLSNTYAPAAEVALDQGAVVYAQPGSSPIFIVPPRISLVNGTLSMLVPRFVGSVGFEAGVGTADISLRLLSAQRILMPSNGISLSNSTPIIITIKTPYAATWYAYFLGYTGLSTDVTCTGPSNVCSPTHLYEPGGPLGTVTLTIPTTGLSLALLVALYSVSIE
jgi:hypothetical protein